MKKHLLGTLVGMVLLIVLCLNVVAADSLAPMTQSFLKKSTVSSSIPDELLADTLHIVRPVSLEELTAIITPENDVRVNGTSIADQTVRLTINQTNYLSIRSVAEALFPDAQVTWQDGQCVVTAPGLSLTARSGDPYLVVNGRYLYVPDGIQTEEHSILAPVRTLCTAFGTEVTWNSADNTIDITGSPSPLTGGYDEESLLWLSRVINAESGNQPLLGKIAVGTVILNRVDSPLFPDTIRDVVFDSRYGSYQFSTVTNGSIYDPPNAESEIAAKLCLDGARAAGSSLYFNVDGLNCWASNNRPYAMTIAGHDFYL